MKTNKLSALLLTVATFGIAMFTSCEKNDTEDPTPASSQFVSLESPYLICASRNPGGVGFDFEYNGEKGGANYMDSLTVNDFDHDLNIKTIKAEKPDGSLSGMPFIQLGANVMAVNYTTVDADCAGYDSFLSLNAANIESYTLQSDDSSFDPNSVTMGTTGKPLLQSLLEEYDKLVIAQRWKTAANNDVDGDEPVWIIQTKEGKIVKFIVTDFPADPAPTSTGYISIKWDFVE